MEDYTFILNWSLLSRHGFWMFLGVYPLSPQTSHSAIKQTRHAIHRYINVLHEKVFTETPFKHLVTMNRPQYFVFSHSCLEYPIDSIINIIILWYMHRSISCYAFFLWGQLEQFFRFFGHFLYHTNACFPLYCFPLYCLFNRNPNAGLL